MAINKQLTILIVFITLFSVIVTTSTFKIVDAARYHQLNSQHFNHLMELNELIAISPGEVPDTKKLKEVVQIIKAQPEACVEMTSTLDRLIMEIVNTESIISICEHDVAVGDDLLNSITLFEKGLMTASQMKINLTVGYNKFRANSIRFTEPVNNLTDFIVKTSTTLIVIFSIIVFLLSLAISKAILNIVKRMQQNSDKLVISEEKNRLLAHKDMLTGLPNRYALDIKINETISKADNKQFAVFFIDLDRFKDVNDTRGHAQGDKLLITIANRLSDAMQNNNLVFRFGGDEFVAVIDFSGVVDDLHLIAENLVNIIAEPIWLDNSEIYVTGSIGISVYPNDADDAECLIKYADTAMYEAKKLGKNQYQLYHHAFSKNQARRLSYESQLRSAIEKDQLKVVDQPVVNLNSFATQGTEALLRWQLDQDTMISPDVFIPIAEYSGQIVEIGEWVLRDACRQNKRWRDMGAKNLNIAVNVSPYQLFNPNFSKVVENVISEFDISRGCLDIEITESMIVSENERFLKTLNELSEMGVRLLMDDFGTGYSCLSYLRKLPFDILKIDKSFVSDYDSIASTIIAMGKQLDMKIIAEGVETQKSLALLQQQQCDFAQGYFFQRPVLPENLDIFKIYNK